MIIKNELKKRWWWLKASKNYKLETVNLSWVCGRNHEFLAILPPNKALASSSTELGSLKFKNKNC